MAPYWWKWMKLVHFRYISAPKNKLTKEKR